MKIPPGPVFEKFEVKAKRPYKTVVLQVISGENCIKMYVKSDYFSGICNTFEFWLARGPASNARFRPFCVWIFVWEVKKKHHLNCVANSSKKYYLLP